MLSLNSMKKLFTLFLTSIIIAAAFFSCISFGEKPVSDTYFVRADGSDRNHGLSEDKPFRSLFKAVVMANTTPVKTITVIGTLNLSSEQSTSMERVFLIQGMEKTPILIRGKRYGNPQ